MPGHLFIAQADLTALACDAVLIPCDAALRVSEWAAKYQSRIERCGSDKPSDWGDWGVRTFRLQPSDELEPELWLTNTGAFASRALEWYLVGVRQFVTEARTCVPRSGRVIPLLGIPTVGIGEGGQSQAKGLPLKSLVQALVGWCVEFEVDIALVNPDAGVVSAVAYARSLVPHASDDLSPSLLKEASRLAQEAAGGRLVLFTGAGTSFGAGLPTWQGLLDRLAERAGMNPEKLTKLRQKPTVDQAQVIEQWLAHANQTSLRQEIAELFRPFNRHSLAHALLATLPVTEAATVNYDVLFELAASGIGRAFATLPYEGVRGRSRWLLKLHGDVNNFDEIVLTREDYLRYTEARGALLGLVQALLMTRHMLFVGFSLRDDNFLRIADDVRRIIHRTKEQTRERFGTVLMVEPDEFLGELWQEDVSLVPMGEAGGPGAARLIDIFLDRVVSETLQKRYLLDSTYDGLLSSAELKLAGKLRELEKLGEEEDYRDLEVWPLVASLLEEFGTPRRTS